MVMYLSHVFTIYPWIAHVSYQRPTNYFQIHVFIMKTYSLYVSFYLFFKNVISFCVVLILHDLLAFLYPKPPKHHYREHNYKSWHGLSAAFNPDVVLSCWNSSWPVLIRALCCKCHLQQHCQLHDVYRLVTTVATIWILIPASHGNNKTV